MELVGQAVPNGNSGVFRKYFHGGVIESPELNSVKHAAQDPGGIFHRFLFAELNVAFPQIFGMSTFINTCHHKGASCACGGFFKNQSDIFSFHILAEQPGILVHFQFGGKINEEMDFLG